MQTAEALGDSDSMDVDAVNSLVWQRERVITGKQSSGKGKQSKSWSKSEGKGESKENNGNPKEIEKEPKVRTRVPKAYRRDSHNPHFVTWVCLSGSGKQIEIEGDPHHR